MGVVEVNTQIVRALLVQRCGESPLIGNVASPCRSRAGEPILAIFFGVEFIVIWIVFGSRQTLTTKLAYARLFNHCLR